jgi:serine/threonine protein kinase
VPAAAQRLPQILRLKQACACVLAPPALTVKSSRASCFISWLCAVFALAQVYLITELLTGGELLDAVLESGSYSEADARRCFVQLLRGIDYLHSKCAAGGTRDHG